MDEYKPEQRHRLHINDQVGNYRCQRVKAWLGKSCLSFICEVWLGEKHSVEENLKVWLGKRCLSAKTEATKKVQQKMLVLIAMLLLAAPTAFALDNGLALTPPMGWFSWERFRCNTDCKTSPNDCISEKLFKDMADRMVTDGYREAGYTYVSIDKLQEHCEPEWDVESGSAPALRKWSGREDCWQGKSRDVNRNLMADKERFPSGIKELADYIHSKGLKIGIYTDFGTKTCAGYPGSIFDMQKDTNLFASWGIDLLKVDGCYSSLDLMADGSGAFGFYLNNTKRPILYQCNWPAYTTGHIRTDYKLVSKLCNIWRNYNDIQDSWKSVFDVINHNSEVQDTILPVVGPGNFNDPDWLVIGDFSLTQDQSKAQFAIWAILAAPLLMSNDLRKIKPWQSEILLNREIIAVNQDKLGKMGRQVAMTSTTQVWARPLINETVAVVLFNTGTDSPLSISFTFKQVGFAYSKAVVRDLYQHKDVGIFSESYEAMVNPTGVVMVTLKPLKGKYNL